MYFKPSRSATEYFLHHHERLIIDKQLLGLL